MKNASIVWQLSLKHSSYHLLTSIFNDFMRYFLQQLEIQGGITHEIRCTWRGKFSRSNAGQKSDFSQK